MSKSKLRKENAELKAALCSSIDLEALNGFRWEDYGRECCQHLGIPEDPFKLLKIIKEQWKPYVANPVEALSIFDSISGHRANQINQPNNGFYTISTTGNWNYTR